MPKAVSAPGFRQTTSGAHGNADCTDRLPRGKPPVYTDVRRFCRKQSPAGGMTCRLRRGVGFVVPWALSSEGEPKGCMGRAESPLQAALHDNSAGSSFLSGSMTRRLRRGWWRCLPMGINSSAFGARRLPKRGSGKHFGAPAGADLLFPVGSDAPTAAREKGLQPYGALTLFFRWRKKSVQKKASGTATTGKRLLLPILTAGLAMSRAAWLARFRMLSCALGARLFPPPKWAGLFPSAAYRRSAPAQSAWGILTPCGLGCFVVA